MRKIFFRFCLVLRKSELVRSEGGRAEECQLNEFLSVCTFFSRDLSKRYIDHLEINDDIPNCNETAVIISISNEASTLNVLFG